VSRGRGATVTVGTIVGERACRLTCAKRGGRRVRITLMPCRAACGTMPHASTRPEAKTRRRPWPQPQGAPAVPSFDIVSRIDLQELDNAINNTRKQVASRYDFRNAKTEINFDRKEKKLHLITEDKMKMEAVKEMLQSNAAKRGIEIKSLKFGDFLPGAQANIKCEVTVREGIDIDNARKIVKMIKDTKMKVQASIQGEEVRVSGNKIDDLQAVIQLLRGSGFELPLQFVNMKR
jgi:uncharacterized protein YajQ (UPF0234 family)